jgi:cholesterol oxidase
MGTSRRNLLRATAAGAGAAVTAGFLDSGQAFGRVPALAGRTAVVVGSGFGGAVAAYRLGRAGVQTTVLERGRRWDVDPAGATFTTTADPDWRCAWFDTEPPFGMGTGKPIGKGAGVIAKHRGDGITVVSGAGVGGGSLIFTMFLPQPRRSEWSTVYPAGVDYDEMDRVYWPRARQALGAGPIPADIQDHPRYSAARAWLEYVAEFGQTGVPVPFAVDWDRIRAELAGTAPPCHTIGEGALGSNSGAKNSVDRNYLKWATDTGNVTVSALHEVTEVHEVSGQAKFEVRWRRIDDHGTVLATGTTVCDYLFLAAGSVHTTSLLVTAKAKGWLPRLGAAVGKGWGNNGDFLVLRLNLRRNVGWAQAGPGNVRFFDDRNRYATTAMGWEAQPMPARLGKPAMAHVLTTMTPERGEIRYDPATGAGRVRWPFAAMETVGDRAGRDLVNRLWWETEGKSGHPFNGLPTYDRGTAGGLGSANTWHPLGGMVMGQATDLGGRSVDYPNLYCVDGSVLPGSTALANPALTITANAERCLDLFLASHT